MENWKDLKGYERIYCVSDLGRLKRAKNETILKTQITNSGYEIAHLHKDKKRKACTVHRLVALNFIENPDDLEQVNHLDGIKTNNKSTNLQWCSKSMNMQHAFLTGLTVNARAKAKERMKLIGSEYSLANGNRLKQFAKEMSIPVLKLSLDGEFLQEYPSIKCAQREAKAHDIRHVISGKHSQSGGFKWALK